MDEPIRCPVCGGPTVTEWVDAGGDPPTMIPGMYRCADVCEVSPGRIAVEVPRLDDPFVRHVDGDDA